MIFRRKNFLAHLQFTRETSIDFFSLLERAEREAFERYFRVLFHLEILDEPCLVFCCYLMTRVAVLCALNALNHEGSIVFSNYVCDMQFASVLLSSQISSATHESAIA